MLFQQSINKIKIIKICIYLIVLALVFKVGYIQIIDRKNIYDKALESWQRSFPVQANRGKIYDHSGNVLATDLTTASLVVVPSQIKDQATTALKLSEILNVDVD
ncbi:MAG: stage V sporulation protein D, partial [Faecalibacillus sp.]